MKVLFITSWYPFENSLNHGIFIQDQARAVQSEHEVIVVASEVNYSSYGFCNYSKQISNHKGVSEHRLLIKRSIPIYNQFNFFLITLLYAWRVARKFKPDIIHGHISYPSAFWSWLLSILINRPYVISEHSGKFSGHFRSRIHKILTRYSLRKAGAITAVSNFTAKQISDAINTKVLIVPNIIDFEKFDALNNKSRKVSEVHFGFLGTLHDDKKGLDILLKAVSKINKVFFLHIGGDGKMLEEYKAMAKKLGISDKCVFHGFIGNWQVRDFMHNLDFFVSASRFESFGMVLAEAMACGLPVVATDSGGPRDYINEKNGIVANNEDEESLRYAILRMMDSYENYDSAIIRDFILQNYSSKAFLGRINLIYKSLVYRGLINSIVE